MIFEHTEYRSYLRGELAERVRKNPSYSLRAMAKQIGVASSSLCEVLKGKSHFSPTSARKVAHGLGLKPEEIEYFLLLVEYDAIDDQDLKASIFEKMEKLNPRKNAIRDLSLDQFRRISDWWHSAILELVYLTGFELTPASAARKLGISALEAELAIERLTRLGLLKRDKSGRLVRSDEHLLATARAPNDAFRKFYRQMLQKIDESLETQTPQERLSGYLTMPFDRKGLKQAEELMDRLFADLIRVSEGCSRKNDVYHLTLHLFNLTHERKPKS